MRSGHSVCQAVFVWSVKAPGAPLWPSDTVTFWILPCATVTEMPLPVLTSLLPFAGVMDTAAPSLATVCGPAAVRPGVALGRAR